MTCWIELPDRKVSVRIAVHEEPEFPTPLERGRVRVPMVTEWAAILGKLAKLEIVRVETMRVPGDPSSPRGPRRTDR